MSDPGPSPTGGAAGAAAPAKPRKLRRILLIQLVLWPVLILGAELGHRVLLRVRGKVYDAAKTRADVEGTLRNVGTFVPELDDGEDKRDKRAISALHPFTGYDIGWGRMLLDRELEALRAGETDERFEVLILGGSVAQMFGQHATERLTEVLKADPRFADLDIHYLTFGRGGFKQPQQLNMLTFLFALGFEPEVVFNLDGFNEVALSLQNLQRYGCHPIYPSIGLWGHMAQDKTSDRALVGLLRLRSLRASLEGLCQRALDTPLWLRSSLLGSWTRSRIGHLKRSIVETQETYQGKISDNELARGPRWIPREPGAPIEDAVAVWVESTRMIDALCRDRGIVYLHALQPTLWDEGAKPRTAEEEQKGQLSKPMLDGVLSGYPRLREEGARLRADEGLRFIDASRLFEDASETIYIDSCHLGKPGNRTLGEFVGRAWLELWPES